MTSFQFSEAYYQEYLQLKVAKQSQSSSPWIIEQGALDHDVGNSSLLTSISSPKFHYISLVDGSKLVPTELVMSPSVLLCPLTLFCLHLVIFLI